MITRRTFAGEAIAAHSAAVRPQNCLSSAAMLQQNPFLAVAMRFAKVSAWLLPVTDAQRNAPGRGQRGCPKTPKGRSRPTVGTNSSLCWAGNDGAPNQCKCPVLVQPAYNPAYRHGVAPSATKTQGFEECRTSPVGDLRGTDRHRRAYSRLIRLFNRRALILSQSLYRCETVIELWPMTYRARNLRHFTLLSSLRVSLTSP